MFLLAFQKLKVWFTCCILFIEHVWKKKCKLWCSLHLFNPELIVGLLVWGLPKLAGWTGDDLFSWGHTAGIFLLMELSEEFPLLPVFVLNKAKHVCWYHAESQTSVHRHYEDPPRFWGLNKLYNLGFILKAKNSCLLFLNKLKLLDHFRFVVINQLNSVDSCVYV